MIPSRNASSAMLGPHRLGHGIERERGGQLAHILAHRARGVNVIWRRQDAVDELGHAMHLLLFQAARRNGWGTAGNDANDEGRLRLLWLGFFLHGDTRRIERLLRSFTRE